MILHSVICLFIPIKIKLRKNVAIRFGEKQNFYFFLMHIDLWLDSFVKAIAASHYCQICISYETALDCF